ncbi:hypothetical protein KIPB_014022, partial [Kipferlia bialata]
ALGRICVRDKATGRRLPRVYVKALCVRKGQTKPAFWKDGYTDLLGVFDYATVSAYSMSEASEFLLYVDGGSRGAVSLTAKPPV